ncbi:MAG: hypothetical protein JWQ87_1993 [Candidatus Sulfotelmatobacter sp.]|nr:hypothetical protein [Candidatus Sulfotelmatobacter sp.]
MATPTVVQAKSATSATTAQVVTPTSPTTAGNLLVAFAYNDANRSMSITDSASQTWTAVPNTPVTVGAGGIAAMWYMPNSASITTVTVSVSVAATLPVIVYEITGAALNTPFDGNAANPALASNSGTGTSLTSGTLTTSNAHDILLYGVGEATTGNFTVGPGYSFNGTTVTTFRAAMQSLGVSAVQNGVTTSMSWNNTGLDRIGIFAAFADTDQSGGGGPTTDQLSPNWYTEGSGALEFFGRAPLAGLTIEEEDRSNQVVLGTGIIGFENDCFTDRVNLDYSIPEFAANEDESWPRVIVLPAIVVEDFTFYAGDDHSE